MQEFVKTKLVEKIKSKKEGSDTGDKSTNKGGDKSMNKAGTIGDTSKNKPASDSNSNHNGKSPNRNKIVTKEQLLGTQIKKDQEVINEGKELIHKLGGMLKTKVQNDFNQRNDRSAPRRESFMIQRPTLS